MRQQNRKQTLVGFLWLIYLSALILLFTAELGSIYFPLSSTPALFWGAVATAVISSCGALIVSQNKVWAFGLVPILSVFGIAFTLDSSLLLFGIITVTFLLVPLLLLRSLASKPISRWQVIGLMIISSASLTISGWSYMVKLGQ